MFTLDFEISFYVVYNFNYIFNPSFWKKKSKLNSNSNQDNFEDCSLFSDGGRKPLSPKGQLFGERLKKFILEQVRSPDGLNFGEDNQPLSVWTSTTNRSKELASYFQDVGEILELNALVDMNPGVTDGLTLEQIKVIEIFTL